MPDYAGLEGGGDHFFQAVGERGKYLSLVFVYVNHVPLTGTALK